MGKVRVYGIRWDSDDPSLPDEVLILNASPEIVQSVYSDDDNISILLQNKFRHETVCYNTQTIRPVQSKSKQFYKEYLNSQSVESLVKSLIKDDCTLTESDYNDLKIEIAKIQEVINLLGIQVKVFDIADKLYSVRKGSTLSFDEYNKIVY
jgi:hypothetical protein